MTKFDNNKKLIELIEDDVDYILMKIEKYNDFINLVETKIKEKGIKLINYRELIEIFAEEVNDMKLGLKKYNDLIKSIKEGKYDTEI